MNLNIFVETGIFCIKYPYYSILLLDIYDYKMVNVACEVTFTIFNE